MVNAQEVTHVIYHGDCDDGFGAAWCAWKLLGDRARYLPAQHGQEPPALESDAVVALVDFSYPRAVVEDLFRKVGGLVILDHHKTAEAELRGLPYAIFDMERSGAHLAWNYFHPGEPLPDFIAYIEDKDLWRFRLPRSKEFTAALRSFPMNFEIWDRLSVDRLLEEGGALLRFQEQVVEAHCRRMRWADLAEYRVPIVNASDLRSEIANRLCQLNPQAPFAAAYYDVKEGFRSWSLRSVGEFDVAELCRRWGGGGHKNAAGFIESQPVPPPPPPA